MLKLSCGSWLIFSPPPQNPEPLVLSSPLSMLLLKLCRFGWTSPSLFRLQVRSGVLKYSWLCKSLWCDMRGRWVCHCHLVHCLMIHRIFQRSILLVWWFSICSCFQLFFHSCHFHSCHFLYHFYYQHSLQWDISCSWGSCLVRRILGMCWEKLNASTFCWNSSMKRILSLTSTLSSEGMHKSCEEVSWL